MQCSTCGKSWRMHEKPGCVCRRQLIHEGVYTGCFVLFILGMWAMFVGLHNIDQGRNFIWIASQFGISLDTMVDCSVVGCVGIGELHSFGLMQLLVGMAMVTVSWLGLFAVRRAGLA